MLFLPNDDKLEAQSKQIIEDVVAREGHCKLVGFRDVPVDSDVVGRLAKVTQPRICQVFLQHKDGLSGQQNPHACLHALFSPSQQHCCMSSLLGRVALED